MIAFRARTYGIAIGSGLAATDPTRVKVTEVIRQPLGHVLRLVYLSSKYRNIGQDGDSKLRRYASFSGHIMSSNL